MKFVNLLLSVASMLMMLGCAGNSALNAPSAILPDTEQQESVQEAPVPDANQSSSLVSDENSERKFIRTADLDFKVKNVEQATCNIEAIVRKQGGFIVYSGVNSLVDKVETVDLSDTSCLETIYFTVAGEISLRVPNENFDSTIMAITQNVEFLNSRTIRAQDIALQILANKLAQKRNAQYVQNVNQQKSTITTQEGILDKQESADNAMLANIEGMDQVNFSTINISISQRETTNQIIVSKAAKAEQYQPSFGQRVLDALDMSWVILSALMIVIVDLSGLIVLGLVIIFVCVGYSRWRKNKKNKEDLKNKTI